MMEAWLVTFQKQVSILSGAFAVKHTCSWPESKLTADVGKTWEIKTEPSGSGPARTTYLNETKQSHALL